MKKLWVDDYRSPPDESWAVARNVTNAIAAIDQFEWDEISLDHDISHYDLEADDDDKFKFSCAETFMPVARYIAAKYWHDMSMPGYPRLKLARLNVVPKISVHSSNIDAGKEMISVLLDVGIAAEHKPMGFV